MAQLEVHIGNAKLPGTGEYFIDMPCPYRSPFSPGWTFWTFDDGDWVKLPTKRQRLS